MLMHHRTRQTYRVERAEETLAKYFQEAIYKPRMDYSRITQH
uniref:Uncharacterized protein n=1 Tax=Arundo donax TaxID=35708 RepID=A0A0A9BK07_ARUDO